MPSRSLLSRTECWLAEHQVQAGRVLVAVSGGADSVSLLRVLMFMQASLQLDIHVAHFDHRLRPESENDAAWVRQLCETLQVPFHLRIADAKPQSSRVEEWARQARYEALQSVACEHRCRWIAVGHTQDDQTETVLHHFLRGSGLKGISGISPYRAFADGIDLIRPLLTTSRSELVEFLRSLQQDFREDSTNVDVSFTRNRLRHQLLPRLREDFNPQVDEAIRRLAEQARDAQAALACLALRLLQRSLVSNETHRVELNRSLFPGQPAAIVREVFSLLWRQQQWPLQQMSHFHWENMAQLAILGEPRSLTLPGRIQITKKRQSVIITVPESLL